MSQYAIVHLNPDVHSMTERVTVFGPYMNQDRANAVALKLVGISPHQIPLRADFCAVTVDQVEYDCNWLQGGRLCITETHAPQTWIVQKLEGENDG